MCVSPVEVIAKYRKKVEDLEEEVKEILKEEEEDKQVSCVLCVCVRVCVCASVFAYVHVCSFKDVICNLYMCVWCTVWCSGCNTLYTCLCVRTHTCFPLLCWVDQMRLSEMEISKAQNMIDHEKEIFSRPARAWIAKETNGHAPSPSSSLPPGILCV